MRICPVAYDTDIYTSRPDIDERLCVECQEQDRLTVWGVELDFCEDHAPMCAWNDCDRIRYPNSEEHLCPKHEMATALVSLGECDPDEREMWLREVKRWQHIAGPEVSHAMYQDMIRVESRSEPLTATDRKALLLIAVVLAFVVALAGMAASFVQQAYPMVAN